MFQVFCFFYIYIYTCIVKIMWESKVKWSQAWELAAFWLNTIIENESLLSCQLYQRQYSV